MKKVIVCILVGILVLTTALPVFSQEMMLTREEIPVMRADDVMADGLVKLDIFRGTGNGLELSRKITRAEATALLYRLHPDVTWTLGLPKPVFSDLDGHWAYKEVTYAKNIGIVEGVGDGKFEPDRTVTGKEFTKMLLSMLGYDEVTMENAYDLGVDAEVLVNNFEKSVVKQNFELLRSDVARILWSSFLAKTKDNTLFYKKMIETHKYDEEDFDILYAPETVKTNFTDSLNEMMPDDENYMFSPLSIKMAFAMAANGADFKTCEEILMALGIDNLQSFNEETQALMKSYQNMGAMKLDVANSIWLNKDNTDKNFNDYYKKLLAEYYFASADTCANNDAVAKINGWVKEKTQNKIDGIISDSNFSAMLVNAIYFKGAWEKEFSKSLTNEDVFTDKNGTKQKTDFMNQTNSFPYYKNDSLEIVELPYKNVIYNEKTQKNEFFDADISMYLIKGNYSDEKLEELKTNRQLHSQRIKLSVPKFKIEFSTGLTDMMKALGVKCAFDEKYASLNKMFDKGTMYISDAIHKTYIGVDEEGTEAAAVTAVMMKESVAIPKEPIVVSYDTPFTFVIRDNKAEETLFIGEYNFVK